MKKYFKDMFSWKKNVDAALPAFITGFAFIGCILATMPQLLGR